MVALVNGRYVDENNNSWDADCETLESAEEKSKTLKDCSGCSGCSDCSGCSGCSDCSRCSRCSRCSGCAGYKQNPQIIMSPVLGSRSSQTALYWVGENVQIVCGCFRGDIAAFRKAVGDRHAGTMHETAYLAWIAAAEAYMEAVK